MSKHIPYVVRHVRAQVRSGIESDDPRPGPMRKVVRREALRDMPGFEQAELDCGHVRVARQPLAGEPLAIFRRCPNCRGST